MPSVLLTESLAVELGAQEPWPQDVKLFQPYEVEQILLPDNANCLAVQAFLKMCGLYFEVEPRSNAEYMSPSGRVPFIKCGAFVVAELDPIISFVNSKGISLSDGLDSSQKADMRAYMSLVNTVLANAELYITWCDNTTLQEVTKPRFGSVLPWPLNHIIAWQKRGQVIKKLGVLGWASKTLDEVYQEVENCCSALSERLANRSFFFGDSPTEFDAMLFSHLCSILIQTVPETQVRMNRIVRQHSNLLEFVKQICNKYFADSDLLSRVQQEPAPPDLDEPPANYEVELPPAYVDEPVSDEETEEQSAPTNEPLSGEEPEEQFTTNEPLSGEEPEEQFTTNEPLSGEEPEEQFTTNEPLSGEEPEEQSTPTNEPLSSDETGEQSAPTNEALPGDETEEQSTPTNEPLSATEGQQSNPVEDSTSLTDSNLLESAGPTTRNRNQDLSIIDEDDRSHG